MHGCALHLHRLATEVCNDAFERESTSAHWRCITMAMSLVEAAAATGVNRSTLFRAYKSGRMTATRTDAGTIEVDAAELFRCFPPQQGALGANAPARTSQRTRRERVARQCVRDGSATVARDAGRDARGPQRLARAGGESSGCAASASPSSRAASELVAPGGWLAKE